MAMIYDDFDLIEGNEVALNNFVALVHPELAPSFDDQVQGIYTGSLDI